MLNNPIIKYTKIIKYQNNKLNQIDIASKLYDNNQGILTIWINREYIKDIEFKNCGFELVYKINELK